MIRPPMAIMAARDPQTPRRGDWLFASPAAAPRARRAGDVLVLVAAAVGLALAVAAAPSSGTERAFDDFLHSLPAWLDPAWGFAMNLLWAWALALLVATAWGRRTVVVGQSVAALVLAGAAVACAARAATGTWPDLLASVTGDADPTPFPVLWIAEAVAVILTVSPHLVRPLRVVSRRMIWIGVAGAMVVATGTPLGAIAAVLSALVASSVARLVAGTSVGRPDVARVTAELGALGVSVHEVTTEAERRDDGSFVFHARRPDGEPLTIKVQGRDAAETRLAGRMWRGLWYRRGTAAGSAVGRLHAAEHEALMTQLARRAGVPTLEVVTAGLAPGGDGLLVLRGDATPVAELHPERADDALLADAWEALQRLGKIRLAHQGIDPSTLVLVDGAPAFTDFGHATLAVGEDHLRADRAQLLATTAAIVGIERAVAAALRAVGPDVLAGFVPFVQPAAFAPRLRRALRAADVDVDELRAGAAEAAGSDAAEPVQLRRVSGRKVVEIVLLGVAATTLLGAAAEVDWDSLSEVVGDAGAGWAALGLLVVQGGRLTQAIAALGAIPIAVPLGRVYVLQLAMGYLNVSLPSGFARTAVNARFFQQQGLRGPTAATASVIDTVATVVLQAALLALLLVFAEVSLPLDFELPSGDARRLVWILAGLLAASALLLAAVPRARRAIASAVRRWWPDVRLALSALGASDKLALLVLGNVATELLLAGGLGLFAYAAGFTIPLTELLVIGTAVMIVAWIVPLPGGVGVAELGYTVGLTAAGLPAETALAVALAFRISIFYLPPLWGFFAFRWLQRERYL